MSAIDLKRLRYENGLTQEALGLELKMSKQQVSKIEKGKANLTKAKEEYLREKYFKSLQSQPNVFMSKDNDCIDIPVKGDVTASMGTGVEVYNETQTGTYQLSRKLLADIGANQQFCEIIFASGDSMEPTIMGGDSLLVDTSKKEIYDGKIYCVRIEGQLYAKRLQKLPPNRVKVVSDNESKYDPFYVDFSKVIDFDFQVIGEIKWWGRVAR